MKYSVLLVDDEPIELECMKMRVDWAGLGLEVAAAVRSGFEALEFLQKKTVDILLTDIRMPIMSGVELARRAREWCPDLKIAFVSGYEDFNYARQALALSAFGYVLKPIDDKELVELLQKIVNHLEEQNRLASENKRLKETFLRMNNETVIKWLEGDEQSLDAESMNQLGIEAEVSQERKIINSVKQYVKDHFHEKLTLKDVADYLGYSPNYLGHIFKEEADMNFSDFLLEYRMRKAAEMLLDPKVKVYEITERIGYKNALHFNRQFKEFFGLSPSEYRRKNKV